MDDDTQQKLSLLIREHIETRSDPKDPVDVHTFAEIAAAYLKLEKDVVADAILKHCDALGAPIVLRVATQRALTWVA